MQRTEINFPGADTKTKDYHEVYKDVTLSNGPPWGFSIRGGSEFGKNLVIDKITEKGSAADSGLLKHNDEIVAINGIKCFSRSEAIQVIKGVSGHLSLNIRRKEATDDCKRFKSEHHEKQSQSLYETVYEEMLENIDTLSTSYSGRRSFIKDGEDNTHFNSSNHGGKQPQFVGRRLVQVSPVHEQQTHHGISGNSKENISPNRIIVADDKELTLNIDLKTGEMWARPDAEETTSTNLEPDTTQRNPSPIGVQKVRVKSVNVTAVHPKTRDGHLQVSQGPGHVRSGSAEPAGHSKSQDGPRSVRSLPRSAASVDNIPLSISSNSGYSNASSAMENEKYRKISHDQNLTEDSGVENTSNMNVRRAKAMFEEISRSTENLLEIGKSTGMPSKQRQSPRQNSLDRKDFSYNETNNNYTSRVERTDEPVFSKGKTDSDHSQNANISQPLVNRFTSIIPHHTHTRSLPVEYEERQEGSTNKGAPTQRASDAGRRPKSAHYLLEGQHANQRNTRRISPDSYTNQAQLMRSFRVSKSYGRNQVNEYASGYEGDEESDTGNDPQRSAIRRSVEDLRYLPNAMPSRPGGGPTDGIPRSSTLPANEMREAAKRYHEQLFRNHPSTFRYSFGHTVEPPRLTRSSSFGSRSRSGSTASNEETVKQESAEKDVSEPVNVVKSNLPEHSTLADSHLSQAGSREDPGNSILSRLLREHSANNAGVSLGKIEEETQGHRQRATAVVRSTKPSENMKITDAQLQSRRVDQDYSGVSARMDRGTSIKTVAVSSTVTPATTLASNGAGERGAEYVKGFKEAPVDCGTLEQRPRAYQYDRSASQPRLDDFVGSALRSQSVGQQQSAPLPISSQRMDPLILTLDRSPKTDRKSREYYQESTLVNSEIEPVKHQAEQRSSSPEESHLRIAHDKEPSTDSVKELREIEESARLSSHQREETYDTQTPDLESLPPPPDELLAESPPEREKPQRTINRKKRDIQALQSSSRNSSCVSTDSTTSTATADSGIGMRPFRSTDSSPRTSPLVDNHSGYEYGEGKEGSQDISDEDEGMPAEPPDATSTPERTDSSLHELKIESTQYNDRELSPAMLATAESSPTNSRPGSASFLSPRFEELDTEKSKLIESMREKIRELRQQELEITEEITNNEVLGDRVRSMIEARAKQTEFSKYDLFIGELNNIVKLLLSLTQRLHRYELMLQDLDMSEEEDKNKRDELIRKIEKLKNQHEEACRLREVNDKRGENVANFLEKYCTEEEYADFQYYVDMKSQLALMQSEIKEKVKLGEERLNALECTGLEWSN